MKKIITQIIEAVLIVAIAICTAISMANTRQEKASFNATIEELTERLDAVDEKIDSTNATITVLTEKVSAIETEVSAKLTALEENINAVKVKVDALDTNNTSLKTLVETNVTKLAALEESVNEQKVVLEQAKTLSELAVAYDELALRMTKAENQISRINFETAYKKTDKQIIVTDAGVLNALSDLATTDGGSSTFADQEVFLETDCDLLDEYFEPIKAFEGTLNGNGKTIEGLKCVSSSESGTADYSYNALIKETKEGAVIKDLTIKGASMLPYEEYEETSCGGYANYEGEKGIVIGKVTGDTTVKGVKLEDCFATTYNNSVGGIAAEVRGGTLTVEDVTIASDVVLQAFWGTYDGPVGGICGMIKNGAHVTIKNCNVACKIDAYNDACANYNYYNYRYAGMLCSYLEGKNATNWSDAVTIEDTVVTFDNWNQYRYCKNEDNYKLHRINELDGSWNDYGAPETHSHTYELEGNHNLLLTFSNIFGFSTGIRQAESLTANIVQVDDHYEDTTTFAGLKIVYLNGSQTGI